MHGGFARESWCFPPGYVPSFIRSRIEPWRESEKSDKKSWEAKVLLFKASAFFFEYAAASGCPAKSSAIRLPGTNPAKRISGQSPIQKLAKRPFAKIP